MNRPPPVCCLCLANTLAPDSILMAQNGIVFQTNLCAGSVSVTIRPDATFLRRVRATLGEPREFAGHLVSNKAAANQVVL
jgi:hypothetical protein